VRQCASFSSRHGRIRRELHAIRFKKRNRKEFFLRAVLVPQGVGAVFLFFGRFLAKQEVSKGVQVILPQNTKIGIIIIQARVDNLLESPLLNDFRRH